MRKCLNMFMFSLVFGLVIFLVLSSSVYSYEDSFNKPVTQMTSLEVMSELRLATDMTQNGDFYPTSRLNELTRALADDQLKLLKEYENKLNRDKKRIEEYETRRDAIIKQLKEEAQQKAEDEWEKRKDSILKEAEDRARKALKISESDWGDLKDTIDQGKDYYERELQDYTDTISTVYNAINAYREAADKHKEAPDAAQNLLGSLAAMESALSFSADKIEKTKLGKPLAEILKFYAEATKLGDVAATAAWNYVHRDNTISDMHKTQYSDAFEQYRQDGGGFTESYQKTPLMLQDENMMILRNSATGEYVVMRVDVENKIWPFRDKKEYNYVSRLSEDEYRNLEMLYSGYKNAIEDPLYGKDFKKRTGNLTAEQLLKLSRGEDINVITREAGLIRSQVEEALKAEDFIDTINSMFERQQSKHSLEAIYESIYGDPAEDNEAGGVFDRVRSLWGNDAKTKRMKEINELFSLYKDTLTTDEFFKGNENHRLENFLRYIQNSIDSGKDLNQVRDQLKNFNKQQIPIGSDENSDTKATDVSADNIIPTDAFSAADLIDYLFGIKISLGEITDEMLNQLGQYLQNVEFYPVRGTVVDSETGDPIPGAVVSVFRSTGASSIVQTDSSGSFSVGKYMIKEPITVTASAEGYISSKRGGSIKSKDTALNITLVKEEEEENVKIKSSILILIDVSGSMRGSKIENAIRSSQTTVDRMGTDDEVAILTFNRCGSARAIVPFTRTTAENKESIKQSIGAISAGGDTAVAEATAFAGNYLRQNARGTTMNLIILSDGEETCGGDPVKSSRELN